MTERPGPLKLFIKYIHNNQLHCTEGFLPHELAAKVKDLKSKGITHLTIHYTTNPPPTHLQ